MSLEPIVGRYLHLRHNDLEYRIFFEEAGQGVPLLCLHTAGADSRQYRHLLNDAAVTSRFRVIAFDLPYHGRSTPPAGWWLSKYRLTTQEYLEPDASGVAGACRSSGRWCSGARWAAPSCSSWPLSTSSELRGIVGLESTAYAPGRYNEFLHHPAIHGGEMTASTPTACARRRARRPTPGRTGGMYSQAGPGVYAGDVHYYSLDWDGRQDITRIDTRVCKVSLLTGEFDYSCTPEMTLAVADAIPGSRVTVMKGIGHFPMIENYPLFRDYLLAELDAIVPGVHRWFPRQRRLRSSSMSLPRRSIVCALSGRFCSSLSVASVAAAGGRVRSASPDRAGRARRRVGSDGARDAAGAAANGPRAQRAGGEHPRCGGHDRAGPVRGFRAGA